jgi:DNA methyltransferase 1-associated protein 1
MELCATYHLRWPIIYDRMESSGESQPKSMEEIKQRYFQVNRLLLNARHEPSNMFTFDPVKESSTRSNLKGLLSRTEEQIQEEDMLMEEILKFRRTAQSWEDERDYLYKIVSYNAEAAQALSERSSNMKKRKVIGSAGLRRKDKDSGIQNFLYITCRFDQK